MPNTIPAAGKAMPKKADDEVVADAMRRLEHKISSLSNMTLILGEMLDQDLKDETDGLSGGKDHYRVFLTNQQLELLAFAWNDVIERSSDLQDSFYQACSGRSVQ